MKHALLSLIAVFICLGAWGQFFSENFESGGPTWLSAGSSTVNDWKTATCAGNGTTLAGTNALYITKGGTQPGCGLDGEDQFAYDNASGATESLIRYVLITAACYETMSVGFDYIVNGDINDYAELVISSDAVTWTVLGSPLYDTPSWTTGTENIPALYDNSNFYIGIRFTYDNATVDGVPIAIDNLQISGTDNTAPNILCPSTQTIYATTGVCEAILGDFTSTAAISDICGDISVSLTQSPTVGTPMNVATTPYSITLTATDGDGNANQCAFDLNVFDTIAPTITCPTGPFSEYLDATCALTVPDYASFVVASDNCESPFGIVVTQSPPPGATVGASTTISYSVTDNFGNSASCNFVMNVIDTVSPTISCPANSTVSTNTGCAYTLADYTSFGSPVDNCTFTGSIGITQSPSIGTPINAGANLITLIATDGSGNTGTCAFTLTVEDTEPPVISSCASNQTVYATSNCDGILGDYTNQVTAFDNCTATMNLVFTQTPASGSLISGTTLVTVTVTDANNNSVDCQFSAFLTDTVPPSIVCPTDLSLAINSSCAYTVPDLTSTVTGTDNCSALAAMSVTQSPVAGASGNGITLVTLNLIDEQGNGSSCSVTITPIDTVAPTITCPTPAPIDNGTACDYSLGYFGSTALILDNCPDYTITQSPAIGTVVPVGTTPITLTVTDAGGNQASCAFDLFVFENELPTITCPSDTVSCDPTVFFSQPQYSDNCLVAVSQTDLSGLTSGSTFPVGITTLEYTAIDSSANAQTCSFTVEILPFPDNANIVADTLALCNQSSALVEADAVSNGTGEWTVSSGSGLFNNQFANTTGVNGIGTGTNVYVWTVSSPSCGSNSDSIVVINAQADLPANTQDTLIACNDLSAALQGNAPLYGTGVWSTTSSAIITDMNSASTTAQLFENGWSDFIWTISNVGCPSTSDTLRVFTMRNPDMIQNDTSVCLDGDPLLLSVDNQATGQSILWSSNNTSVQFSDATTSTTFASHLINGENQIICSFNYPGCVSTYDSITVIGSICNGFEPIIPTVITPGNLDGKNDLFNIDFLDILYPNCHVVIVNRWGSIVYESTGYSAPWNGTHQGKLLPMGTYFYKIELNDENQQILTGDISIIH